MACQCDPDEKNRIGGQRVTLSGTFPTALLRTWHASFRCTTLSRDPRLFNATPALVLWPTSACESGLLWRLAMWLALPTSDYYRHSVTLLLSQFRPSPSYRSPSLRPVGTLHV